MQSRVGLAGLNTPGVVDVLSGFDISRWVSGLPHRTHGVRARTEVLKVLFEELNHGLRIRDCLINTASVNPLRDRISFIAPAPIHGVDAHRPPLGSESLALRAVRDRIPGSSLKGNTQSVIQRQNTFDVEGLLIWLSLE